MLLRLIPRFQQVQLMLMSVGEGSHSPSQPHQSNWPNLTSITIIITLTTLTKPNLQRAKLNQPSEHNNPYQPNQT